MKKILLLVPALMMLLLVQGNGVMSDAVALGTGTVAVVDTTIAVVEPQMPQDTTKKELAIVRYIMSDSAIKNDSTEIFEILGDGVTFVSLYKPKDMKADSIARAIVRKRKADTLAAREKRRADSIAFAIMRAYEPPAKPYKSNIVWGGGRNRWGKFSEECAAHANYRLARFGIASSGHAYQIPAHFTSHLNGYSHIKLPNLKKLDSCKHFSAIMGAHRRAADYVKEHLDLKTLDQRACYVVNMYYCTSPHMLEFYYAARRQGTRNYGTHVGVLYFDQKSQHWIVEHNIHGNVYRNSLLSVLGGRSNPHKFGVTSISLAGMRKR